MTKNQRVLAAERVIANHRSVVALFSRDGDCRCGVPWSSRHMAEMLDTAGLLCALADG